MNDVVINERQHLPYYLQCKFKEEGIWKNIVVIIPSRNANISMEGIQIFHYSEHLYYNEQDCYNEES
jgi:hypothetical protein